MKPFVSLIIPCRNEEKFIAKCLNSLICQDFPKDKLEILVVDGISEDRTREIISKFKIQLIDNPKKYISSGLNIGIRNAKGEIIIRMDSHASYQKDYVSKCVTYLRKYKADNVGGVIKTIPAENTLTAKTIAICLSHSFGAGGSYFRTGANKPKWVDTVFGGCYKKELFEKIGFYNENMERSEDIEFNLRLKRAGGKILFAPDIICYYYPKSKLRDFFCHNINDGIWAILPLKYTKTVFAFRHYMPFLFISSLMVMLVLGIFLPFSFIIFIFIISFYLLISFYFSVRIAIKEKDIRFLYLMPISFATRHFAYGLGSIWGLIKLLI